MNGSTLARWAPWRDPRQMIARGWTLAGGMRGLLVGAVPLVLEAISPNRVAVSFIIAAFYLVAALILARPRASGRPAFIFAVVAVAFVGLSILRLETIDPLNEAQRSYGLAKATYFIEVLIPLAFAVALLVNSVDDLKPAVITFMLVGLVVGLVTVVSRDQALFTSARYTTQGNLIAMAGLLACQFWIIRDFRIGAALALLCLVGVVITQSRQSMAAYVIGLGVTGVYWFAADRVRAAAPRAKGSPPVQEEPSAIWRMWMLPAAGYGLVLGAVVVWAAFVLQPGWIPVPTWVRDPVTCNCIAGRFVNVATHPGGRDVLIEQGWALFASHPLFGGGLGSFVGLGPYSYPHNIGLEIAGEMGLFGVLVLLVPVVVGWVRLAMAGIKAASPAVASAIIVVVVYAVVSSLSGDIASARGWWVFGLVVLKLGWRPDPAEAVVARL